MALNNKVIQGIKKSFEDAHFEGCKNLLNFICDTMKFHYYHHSNERITRKSPEDLTIESEKAAEKSKDFLISCKIF